MDNLSLQARFGTAGAGLDLFGVGAVVIYPEGAIYFAVPALILGTILIFLAVLPSGLFNAIASASWRSFIYGFIPLHKAAKKAYEKNYDNLSANFAEQDFENFEADPISWFANALIGSNVDETGVAIFGCKPQLDILTEIPRQKVYSHHLVVNEKEALLQDMDSDRTKYDRLHIRKSDMEKRIKEISTWGC